MADRFLVPRSASVRGAPTGVRPVIISRTPFRVSLFGGGTDYPAWYRENGGAVIGTAVNKFSYITCRYLPPFHEFRHLIRYYRREEAQRVEDIQHPSVRECLRFLGIEQGVDIVHHGDVPARSGLGSSSTFTVGLLHALYALKHEMPTKRELALNAIHVEQNLIGENVGSQDQTLAAFGGLLRVDFGGPHEILVKPLLLAPERLASLERRIMLFFTGLSRTASEIAAEQLRRIAEKRAELRRMREMVDEAERILADRDAPLSELGALLHEQWLLKRTMSSQVTTPALDDLYEAGRRAGALGGKLLGAGGGGFMLFFVEPEQQAAVRDRLAKLLTVPVRFDHLGSQIVYFSRDDHY
jgi:D-glycero-alpha-D-manno-heptose-7-phosphate kinase